jgi:hypothetical protein
MSSTDGYSSYDILTGYKTLGTAFIRNSDNKLFLERRGLYGECYKGD